MLYGIIKDEKISIAIFDHPENPNFPTYWHTRGYGLFSANPFGVKDFSKGDKELNYKIQPNQTINFKYRIAIGSKVHFSEEELKNISIGFANKYKL
jgi:hypothetical protein